MMIFKHAVLRNSFAKTGDGPLQWQGSECQSLGNCSSPSVGECSARLLAERGGDFAAAFKSQRRTARLVDSSRPGVSLHGAGAGAGAGAASVISFPTPTFFFDLAELFDRNRF